MHVVADTNVLIRLNTRGDETLARLMELGVTRVAITTVTYGEFLGGVAMRRKAAARKFLQGFELIPFDDRRQRTAHYLVMRYKLKPNQGADFMIACVARTHRLAVLTENIRDFQYGSDVRVVKF